MAPIADLKLRVFGAVIVPLLLLISPPAEGAQNAIKVNAADMIILMSLESPALRVTYERSVTDLLSATVSGMVGIPHETYHGVECLWELWIGGSVYFLRNGPVGPFLSIDLGYLSRDAPFGSWWESNAVAGWQWLIGGHFSLQIGARLIWVLSYDVVLPLPVLSLGYAW